MPSSYNIDLVTVSDLLRATVYLGLLKIKITHQDPGVHLLEMDVVVFELLFVLVRIIEKQSASSVSCPHQVLGSGVTQYGDVG